jgi:hypothetical protein
MKELKEKVSQVLKQYPETRKSDNLLMIYIWREEYTKIMKGKWRLGSLISFFHVLKSDKLSDWESVIKIKRELQ